MTIEQLNPQPTDKVKFDRYLLKCKPIPTESGCYILTTSENYILYVGQTGNLYRRFTEHLADPEKTTPTEEGKAFWFYFILYNVNEIGMLETSWAYQFKEIHGRLPIFNKKATPPISLTI